MSDEPDNAWEALAAAFTEEPASSACVCGHNHQSDGRCQAMISDVVACRCPSFRLAAEEPEAPPEPERPSRAWWHGEIPDEISERLGHNLMEDDWMHPAALHWAKLNVPELPRRVLDIGGADINCSLRNLYTWSDYRCVDIAEGPGVDIVADFITWSHEVDVSQFDLIVCFEVFEHMKEWAFAVHRVHTLLEPGGLFVGTCATDGRTPHSAWGDPHPRPGEHYMNVPPGALAGTLVSAGFKEFTVDVARDGVDLRWKARKT